MSNEKNRVLGRILAVEESMMVSGAKNTAACYDLGYFTYSNTDTNSTYDCLTGINTDTGTVVEQIASLSIINNN